MAQEIREFAVTVPAMTPQAAPLVTDVSFPQRVVTAVSWRVPPGPAGLMGWALTSDGAPVIPVQPGTWMVTDNQAATWDLDGYLDSGSWQVTAYNEGIYPHTVYLTFQLDLTPPASPSPAPAPGSGAAAVGMAGTVTPLPPPRPPRTSPAPPAGTGGAAIITTAATTAAGRRRPWPTTRRSPTG